MKDTTFFIIDRIIIFSLLLLFICVFFITSVKLNKFQKFLDNIEREQVLEAIKDTNVINQTKLFGTYSPKDDVLCIYTGSKTQKEKLENECHEYIHHLIYNDSCYEGNYLMPCKEHFCKDVKI